MTDSMIPLASTLAALWHFGSWGLAIILAVLWAWELSASRRQAKTERNLQEWSAETHNSNSDRFDQFSTDPELSSKTNADILSRISPHAAQRQGH